MSETHKTYIKEFIHLLIYCCLTNLWFWHPNQGGSGVGFGNFMEIGPLDGNLQPRNLTWLRKADLLFVVFIVLSNVHFLFMVDSYA